jgi:WD40 repeat protein/serine/threonine protein kinase
MPELTESEKAIFQAAVSLPDPTGREEFLRQACGSDALMLSRLQRLLAADDAAEDFLKPPVGILGLSDGDDFLDIPCKQIGKYNLLQKIGEGGFGVVYMAEQQEPVARKVAIKVIKLGMDTKQVIARFEAERQALSMMDHPFIAKVFDGGATETGRPFFAMELVRGVPIVEYCDQQQLTNEERLSLLRDICSAVQHAHQKGVIHRDLKPSNILITQLDGRPIPKVIDFGIAKAIQGRLTDKTLFTRFEQFVGTPAYMSPEQAEMGSMDIDTRSDIYSMGVLLYELLTGQIPFGSEESSNAGYDIIRRRIQEQEPPTPSTLLSSLQQEVLSKVAQNRHGDPVILPSLLRGDLDWIVMKAMEKDRSRRYESAGAFAEDIDRYLKQLPVTAAPPNRKYRLQKFVQRNLVAISVGATIATILILATTVSLWQAIRAVRAEREESRLLVVAEKALAGEKAQSQAAQEAAELAEAGELRARQVAYASDMLAVDQALELNNLGHARRLLDRNRPSPGEKDLRDWEWRALWQRCRSDVVSTFSASDYEISSVDVSPDGKWLATGQMSGEIRVWDIHQEKTAVILSPRIPGSLLRGQVVFAPEGDRLFTTAGDGVVKVWETASWKETKSPFSHGAIIGSINLSHDGSLLTIFGHDEMISLWDVNKQTERGKIFGGQGGHPDKRPLAISNDNQWLAIGLGDGRIRIMDLATLEERFQLPTTMQGERTEALAFSPDGEILASSTGLASNSIDLWSVSDQKLIDRLEGHARYVHSLAFSQDGKQLASASADQTLRIWDTETWQEPIVLKGHQQEVWALTFFSDSVRLASGSKDGKICIWDSGHHTEATWPISLPNELLHFDRGIGQQGRASFSHDGQWLATLNKDGSVSLRTTQNLTETHRLSELGSNNTGVLFSPRQRLLFVGDASGFLSWFDPLQPREKNRQRLATSSDIFPIGFSRDRKKLLLLSSDEYRKIRCILYSVGGSEAPPTWTSWIVPETVDNVALSPDGQLVVTGHMDGTIRFWQVDDPRKPIVVSHRLFVTGVAFSPDGKLLATGTRFGEARLWDVATQSMVANLYGHLNGIHAIRFSPDGKRLATAGSAGESVKLWDIETRQEVATLNAPGYAFGKIEFSPDGNAILASSFNDSLSLWRVPSWKEIHAAENASLFLYP